MFNLFYGNFVVINNEKDQFTIFIRQNYTNFLKSKTGRIQC
jgi:hypothetical protein